MSEEDNQPTRPEPAEILRVMFQCNLAAGIYSATQSDRPQKIVYPGYGNPAFQGIENKDAVLIYPHEAGIKGYDVIVVDGKLIQVFPTKPDGTEADVWWSYELSEVL